MTVLRGYHRHPANPTRCMVPLGTGRLPRAVLWYSTVQYNPLLEASFRSSASCEGSQGYMSQTFCPAAKRCPCSLLLVQYCTVGPVHRIPAGHGLRTCTGNRENGETGWGRSRKANIFVIAYEKHAHGEVMLRVEDHMPGAIICPTVSALLPAFNRITQ